MSGRRNEAPKLLTLICAPSDRAVAAGLGVRAGCASSLGPRPQERLLSALSTGLRGSSYQCFTAKRPDLKPR